MDSSSPQSPNISTWIEVHYWCKNCRLVSANIPRIQPDVPEDLDTPEELDTLRWIYHQLTLKAGCMEYREMGWLWSPLHMTLSKVVHYASSSSIWVVTTWHRIVCVLKNLAELGQWIELGSWWVATVEGTMVQTECVADSALIWISECSIPVMDTPFSWYSVVLGYCSKVSGRLGNIFCRTSLSAVQVCWIHNMYAVSVREEGEFGFTKERFNIEKEQ